MVDNETFDQGTHDYLSYDYVTSTTNPENVSENASLIENTTTSSRVELINDPIIQSIFCLLYTTIFILGVFGNVLVCYVVYRNRAMQTVTNFFIMNLALSDILLCILAVPFTPLYSFLGEWVFGQALCHMVAYSQGSSVYISTLTLMSIAIDRYCVIIYPFQPRMKLSTCFSIICCIWVFSLLVTLPYGIYMKHNLVSGRYYCDESWPSEGLRQVFGMLTAIKQFVIPLFIISFCYIKVSIKLNDRARAKPGSKNSKKEESDRERKRRTNRMLIAMVTIFAASWMPLNAINLVNDIFPSLGNWKYYLLCFFMVHALAMSSTCYNPFLYAWLNENFRKEFKQVLPCFDTSIRVPPGTSARSANWRSERTCNGNNETMQETLLTSTVHRSGSVRLRNVEDTSPISSQPVLDGKPRATKDDSVDVETVMVPTATYKAENDTVHLQLIQGVGRTSPPVKEIEDGYENIYLSNPLQDGEGVV